MADGLHGGRQATAAPFAIGARPIRIDLATGLFLATFVGSPLYAQQLTFECEWQESSPPYLAQFNINVEAGTATRSDSDTDYSVLSVSEDAIWLKQNRTTDQIIAIATFARSQVGGKWTDTQLLADGTALPISGGYCVEATK